MTAQVEKKTVGRKTILTKEMIQIASKMIVEGATHKAAMDTLGVSHDTWYKWIDKGENNKDPLYTEFADSLKKAKARLQYDCINMIKSAAREQWQAAAWILERTSPEDYGRKDRLDMNVTGVQIIDNIPATKLPENDSD